ncbi:hypothetical protein ACKVMT_08210 [Halobacteriales archaeon Cl-PHB]
MQRRTLLRRAGAVGALVLAGCTGQAGDGPEGGETDPTPSPTPSPSPTATGPMLDSKTFEIVDTGPASEDDRSANVTFETDSQSVIVTGTIIGANGCTTARLGAVEFDREASEVSVDVVTKRKDGTEDKACTQALVGIDYTVTLQFDGGIPDSASVFHDGQGVMSGGHDSASAGEPAGPRVTDRSLEVTDSGMASSEAGSAVVSFPDDDTVRVEGTIVGSDGCKTADLASLAYDPEHDRLVVAVVTIDRPDAGDGCTDALVGIDYVATASLAGGLPGDVTVTHDGERVETATYQG